MVSLFGRGFDSLQLHRFFKLLILIISSLFLNKTNFITSNQIAVKEAFIRLHLSILLAGCTGLFGKLITLNETTMVWYRMVFTSVLLLIITFHCRFPKINKQAFLNIAGTGTLLGLHWMLFYGSIKASNVSIGVLCYSLVGFFTAIIEPLFYHRRISLREVLFSLITVAGILMIFSFDSRYRWGICIGTLSSLVAAIFMVCNKKVSCNQRASVVLLYEMIGGLIPISLIIPVYLQIFPSHIPVIVWPTGINLFWICCHSLFCTVFMYLLLLQALKKLSAFTVNLSYNLEPVYSIIFAMIFFGEAKELNFSFYTGLYLIILSVLLQSGFTYYQGRIEKRRQSK